MKKLFTLFALTVIGFVASFAAEEEPYVVKVTVMDETKLEAVEGATVTFFDIKQLTNEVGQATFEVPESELTESSYPVTVYKDGYAEAEATVAIKSIGFTNVRVLLQGEEASLTVKVFTGEEPAEGATVYFQDEEYVTPENGEVAIKGIYAPDVIGQTVPFTVYKDGYEFYEGQADFTEGFDAFSLVELVAAEASLTIKVTDADYEPIAGAIVYVNEKEYETNESGSVFIGGFSAPDVLGKTVAFSVYKDGYVYYEGEAEFDMLEAQKWVQLEPEMASLTVIVTYDEEELIEGAMVTFNDETYFTDETGKVVISDIPAPSVIGSTFPVTVYKDGYEFFEGVADFTEGFTAWVIADLTAAEASLTIKVMDGEDPLENAVVTFEESEYTTDAYGEVKITGISAPAVIGRTIALTVTKEGYEPYEGVADFTETMEAFVVVELTAIKSGIDAIISDIENADAKVYDLNGRRVINPQSGRVYIVNGQKTLLNR